MVFLHHDEVIKLRAQHLVWKNIATRLNITPKILRRWRRDNMVGKSVHNQRIERLWRNINHVTYTYKMHFHILAIQHNIDLDDPANRYVINIDCFFLLSTRNSMRLDVYIISIKRARWIESIVAERSCEVSAAVWYTSTPQCAVTATQ